MYQQVPFFISFDLQKHGLLIAASNLIYFRMEIAIETERLLLRNLCMEDVEGMYLLDSNPNVHRYLGNNPITSKSQAVEILNRVLQQYEEIGYGRWAIIYKPTNDFVGWGGLKYEQQFLPDNPYHDIGYRLREEYWGMGIGKEVATVAARYAFEVHKFEKLNATAQTDNIGSNKILSGIGMHCIKTFEKDNMLLNWYELTKQEWELLQKEKK